MYQVLVLVLLFYSKCKNTSNTLDLFQKNVEVPKQKEKRNSLRDMEKIYVLYAFPKFLNPAPFR